MPTGPERPTIVLPVLASGISIGLSISAVLFNVSARQAARDAREATTLDQHATLERKVKRNETVSWIAGGVAVGLAAASVYLWVRVLRAPGQVEVSATGDGGAVALTGRW
jgi:hypothetical protein